MESSYQGVLSGVENQENDGSEYVPKYRLSADNEARLEQDFVYHPPKNDQQGRYQLIRGMQKRFARLLMENCPPSRELSLALTHLEECGYQANASIARHE